VLVRLTSHLIRIGSKYSPGVFFVLFCYVFFLSFFPLIAVLSVSSVSLAIDDLAIILFLFLSLELHIECSIVRPRKFSGLLLNLRC
jgi:hypothetical protein